MWRLLRGVERRDADEAVNAHFALQVSIGVVADDVDRRALQSRLVPVLAVDQLRLPAALFRVPQVHPQEHLRPVLRLRSARARVDHHPRVLRVLGSAHLDGELELVRECSRGAHGFARVRLGRFSLAEQVAQGLELFGELVQLRRRLDRLLVAAGALQDRLRLFGARPEVGSRGLFFQLVERAPRGVEIKDSPEAPRGVPRRREAR